MDANAPPDEEPIEISPAAEAAMRKLVELFSDPAIAARARFRCSIEGPTEFDVLFESIIDEQYGYDPNSEYKRWVRNLHRLGLIQRIPIEWEAPETPDENHQRDDAPGKKEEHLMNFPHRFVCVPPRAFPKRGNSTHHIA